MKISLKNIAKVKQADIEINGITVIAGANNTGKSTVGKALFSVFNSLSKIEEQERDARIKAINFTIKNLPFRGRLTISKFRKRHELASNIYEKFTANNESSNTYIILESILFEELSAYDPDIYREISENGTLEETIQQIIERINIDSNTILVDSLEGRLNNEFIRQISNFNLNESGSIQLSIANKTAQISLQNDSIITMDNNLNLRTEVIYIDNPYIINDLETDYYRDDHTLQLREKLKKSNNELDSVSGIVIENNLQEVYRAIDSACAGNMKFENGSYIYQENGKDKPLFVENLSTGLKTFVILKTLLQNGHIEQKGSIVLDEPEVHLHPEWQLAFAEILVLLQKTFDLHILLNTHSPYFLRAIQVYAAKHEIADECKYYLSRIEDDGAYIEDVSDDIEKIYKSLVRPLQILENEEWEING